MTWVRTTSMIGWNYNYSTIYVRLFATETATGNEWRKTVIILCWLQNKQGIHGHPTPPRYRHPAGDTRCNVQSLRFAIRPITTERDVIHKPEVHNVSQRRPKRTEPRTQATSTKSFAKIGPAVPELCSRRDRHSETDTQTDKLIAIHRSATGAE